MDAVPVDGAVSGKKHETEEVIVLDDDEPAAVIDLVGQVAVGDRKCINYQCQSGVELMTPPVFCLSFYRVRNDSNKNQKICRECYDLSVQHYDELYVAITEGGNIMDVDYPTRDETFAIEDSDSDSEEKKEEVMLDPGTMAMLEENFDDVLEGALLKVDYKGTVDEAVKCLQQGYEANDASYNEVKTMVDSIRKEVDMMLMGLFGKLRVENISKPELIIDDGGPAASSHQPKLRAPVPKPLQSKPTVKQEAVSEKIPDGLDPIPLAPPADLPPRGHLVKPPLKLGDYYYAKRNSNLCAWVVVRLDAVLGPGTKVNNVEYGVTMYQMSRETNGKVFKRLVPGRELAYSKRSDYLLEVGARVLALFKEFGDLKISRRDAYYPGVVGESPSRQNQYRYLIFFDDGYAYYVHYNNVFVIYESSKDVWEDVGSDSKAFIKKYLTEYPNRSMVKLAKHQTVRTEFKGKWYVTTVLNVDCSLVQLFFDSQNRSEWIYRGSRRLDAMYREGQIAGRHRNARTAVNNAAQKAPYVQYTRDDPDVIFVDPEEKPELQRSVAKKSTRTSTPSITDHSTKPFLPEKPKIEGPPGKIVYYTPRKQNPSNKIYKPHKCSEECQNEMPTTLQRLKGYGPLAKPLLCGFYRVHYKVRNKKPFVIYKTPCGRSIRNMDELHTYLSVTKSQLTVDLFNFEYWVRCLAEFILEPNTPIVKDLSQGFEEIQIPVVNYVDNELNDFVNYSTKRMPMEGVNLNLDPEFLVGCDCEDDCSDKKKCRCWQQTLQGTKYLNRDESEIGYEFRRLNEAIFTGIYECNSRCKCAKTCLNRVVQNPLAHKLQVFKTLSRGWGIRCINDIPQGAFICIYAGALLTDQMANEGGKNYGDEYLAELDYIESVEAAKEDYEEEAYESCEEESKKKVPPPDEDDDDEETARSKKRYRPMKDNDFVAPRLSSENNSGIRTRLRRRPEKEDPKKIEEVKVKEEKVVWKKPVPEEEDCVTISDDEEVREPSSFNPTTEDDPDEPPRKYRSVREMFGKDENVYIMDAKNTGNIGRYLNHSCSPNVFVQNVFVDTHDLRFPWVSFFAINYIRAGTELTWNYNYDIGSVEGKVLYCHCGAADCKGRLL